MKHTIINLAAVLTALIVGLTINNACAEKIDSDTSEDIPVTARFFTVDGLLFGPDGKVCNRLKSFSGVGFDYMHWFGRMQTQSFLYDDKGRLSEIRISVSSGIVTVSYKYAELKVIETVTSPDGPMSTEYYYYPVN